MSEALILNVRDLHAGYGRVPVLHGIDFSVNEGQIVGVLGHNGMGKTTLLKTLMGMVPATSGRIEFDGVDISDEPAYERSRLGLGYVPQGRGIFPQLSVYDNLRMGVVEHGEEEHEAIEAVIQEFPALQPLLDRSGGALSGGEQQILALARCLISKPDLVFLDEPTEGIQPSIIDGIIDLLKRLNTEQGLAIVLVEQNLEFVTSLSDRVLLLQKGDIIGEVGDGHSSESALIEKFLGFGSGALMSISTSHTEPTRETTPTVSQSLPTAPTDKERYTYMTVKRPTQEQLREITLDFGMHLSDERITEFLDVMEDTMKVYDVVDAMPDYLPTVDYPRTPGYRPSPEENPLNAWYIKCEVKGAPRGPLAGKTIVLKDNISLAGVPMMNGASTLEGYIPDIDATIVTRILDAGGTIVGKAHCEYFCLSGGSHTNATGPCHNPHKMGYSAGGSSSGSGALVASGEVDMAMGGDQGGSIRMPAAYCGCYGLKPTHGLVPYTGVMPIETTIDHTGPMTQNVADNALLLEVIAGKDGLDPRQYSPQVDHYTSALGRGVRGLKIGVVQEGFGRPESESDVDTKVRTAADKLRDLGADVEDISIPMHNEGAAIWTPIALEGLTNQMMKGNGFGTGWKGLYSTSLLDHHSNWPNRADELSDTLKICMFVGEYFLRHYRGHYYAKAQNLGRKLKETYNDSLSQYDLFLMPTLPMKATPLPPPDASLALYCQRAFEMLANTSPFDVTGHPAMSVPCGMSEGLPVGMMLISRHYGESTIYQAAHAFEQLGDWKQM